MPATINHFVDGGSLPLIFAAMYAAELPDPGPLEIKAFELDFPEVDARRAVLDQADEVARQAQQDEERRRKEDAMVSEQRENNDAVEQRNEEAEEAKERAKQEAERLQRESEEAEKRAKREAEVVQQEQEEMEQRANQEAEKLHREQAEIPLKAEQEKEWLQRERKEREQGAIREVERRDSEEAEQQAMQEAEKLQRKQEEREQLERQEEDNLERVREEATRQAKQDEERLQREQEETERLAQEEEERRRSEEAEQQAMQKGKKLQRRQEEREQLAQQEAERLQREQAEEERLAKQEEESAQKEEEEAARLAQKKEEIQHSEEAERLAMEKAETLQREQEEQHWREEAEEKKRVETETSRREMYARKGPERLAAAAEAQAWQETARRLYSEASELPMVAEVDGVGHIEDIENLPREPDRQLPVDSPVPIRNGILPAANGAAPFMNGVAQLHVTSDQLDMFCSLRAFAGKRKQPDANGDAGGYFDGDTNDYVSGDANGASKWPVKSLTELYGKQAQRNSSSRRSRQTSIRNPDRPAIVTTEPNSFSGRFDAALTASDQINLLHTVIAPGAGLTSITQVGQPVVTPVAVTAITPASSGFQGFVTGNNRALEVSDASMSRARALMASVDGETESSSSAGDFAETPAAATTITPLARINVARPGDLLAAPSTRLLLSTRGPTPQQSMTPTVRPVPGPNGTGGRLLATSYMEALGAATTLSLNGPMVGSRQNVAPRAGLAARTSSIPAIEEDNSHDSLLQSYNTNNRIAAGGRQKRRRLSFSSPRVVSQLKNPTPPRSLYRPSAAYSPLAPINESGRLSFSHEQTRPSPVPKCAKISLANVAGSDVLQNLSREAALSYGVDSATLAIDPGNAVEYRFYKKVAGTAAGLDPLPARAGWSEARAAIIAQGCDKQYCSDAWVRNHYRWIVWKLASIDRRISVQSGNRYLGWSQVVGQLLHRYRREFVSAERSCLKKILEKDESPSRFMVLCVAGVTCVTKTGSPVVAELELTDGWYSVRAGLDFHLSQIASEGGIFVGQKLRIVSATLGGATDAVTPLEAHTAYLKLALNSTRRARWNARLGLQPGTGFVVNLASVRDGGGTVPCIRAIVTRQYPMIFLDMGESGAKMHRNEKAEDRANQRHVRYCESKLEALNASMQNGGGRRSEAEVEAAMNSLTNSDPMFVRRPLPYFKVKIVELAIGWEQHFLPGSEGTAAMPLLSGSENTIMLWRGSEQMMSSLAEGQMLSVYNLTPSSYNGQVGLSTIRSTNIEPIKPPPGPCVSAQLAAVVQHLSRKNCSPRFFHALSTGDEFDVVAFVVHTVVEVADEGRQRQLRLWCADSADEMLVVEIREDDAQQHITGTVDMRRVLLMSNLEYIGYDPRTRLHSAGATVRSTFATRIPKVRVGAVWTAGWGAYIETAVCDLSVWGSSELGRTDLAAKQRRARISDGSASSLGVQSLASAGVQATGSVQGQMRLGADIVPHVSFKRKLLAVCDIILASPPCSPACSRGIISVSSPPGRTPLASNVSNTPMTPPMLQRRNVNNFVDLLEIVLDVDVDDGQRIFPVRLPAPVLRRIVDLLFPGTSLATPRPIRDAGKMPNLLDWASTLYRTGECVGDTAAEDVCTARLRVMRQVAKELAAPPDLASLLLLVLTCSVVVSPSADITESNSARRLVTTSNAPGACPYTLVFLSSEWGHFCELFRTALGRDTWQFEWADEDAACKATAKGVHLLDPRHSMRHLVRESKQYFHPGASR